LCDVRPASASARRPDDTPNRPPNGGGHAPYTAQTEDTPVLRLTAPRIDARRAGALAAALLAAVTTACSDSPTAPAGADHPAARDAASLAKGENAQRGIGTGTTVTVGYINSRDVAVPNTVVEFTAEAPLKPITKLVADNDASDADPRVGHYKVQMPITGGKYRAVLKSAPAEYLLGVTTPWQAAEGGVADLWIRYVYLRPIVTLRLESTFGGLVGAGAAFSLPAGLTMDDPWRKVQDNGPGDLSPEAGIVRFRAVSNGVSYKMCEEKAPPNFALANPVCTPTGQLAVESAATFVIQHAPYWF
jgi:hypothetical protein